MRSILEKALIALLNEEKSKADALFHDFILERSRQIHESLRQGEDFILDESWEKELSVDEMFTEADLEDEEAEVEVEVEGDEAVDADVAGEQDDEEFGDDAEVESEVEPEAEEAEEESLEDRVESIEDELTRLSAEFDAIVSDEEVGSDESDSDESLEATEEEGEIVEDFDDLDLSDESVDLGFDDELDAEFDSLGESIVDELESVDVKNAEGQTTAEKVAVDTTSRAKTGTADTSDAEPVEVESDEHAGFDLEAAPKAVAQKARKNTLAKADSTQTKVSKEGDKAALLNTLGDDATAQKGLFSKKVK